MRERYVPFAEKIPHPDDATGFVMISNGLLELAMSARIPHMVNKIPSANTVRDVFLSESRFLRSDSQIPVPRRYDAKMVASVARITRIIPSIDI
jgi:hypothetical protein